MKYVAQISAHPGEDMYWSPWVIIDTMLTREQVDAYIKGINIYDYVDTSGDAADDIDGLLNLVRSIPGIVAADLALCTGFEF